MSISVEVEIELDQVLSEISDEDIIKMYHSYDDLIQAMDTQKLCKSLKASLYEHCPYELFDAIKDEIDDDTLLDLLDERRKSPDSRDGSED